MLRFWFQIICTYSVHDIINCVMMNKINVDLNEFENNFKLQFNVFPEELTDET